MATIYTLLGAVAAPALGVGLLKHVVIEPKTDDINRVATKVASTYGTLALGGLALATFAKDGAVKDLGKGMMYSAGTIAGIALGDRLFFGEEQSKSKALAEIAGEPNRALPPAEVGLRRLVRRPYATAARAR